jgi:hypothetical protein
MIAHATIVLGVTERTQRLSPRPRDLGLIFLAALARLVASRFDLIVEIRVRTAPAGRRSALVFAGGIGEYLHGVPALSWRLRHIAQRGAGAGPEMDRK